MDSPGRQRHKPLPPFDAKSAAKERNSPIPPTPANRWKRGARSYPTSNCGHCHNLGGGGAVDLRCSFPF